jgi:hypothetical protein
VFGHLLGLGSFDNPEGTLACKQTFFLITFNGIGFILMTSIAPTTYLGNLTLLTLILTARFMVDQHPFLLEALTRVDSNILFFQIHLKVVFDLLSLSTCTCLPSFKQFIGQQTVQLQDSISECLHPHTLLNMIFDGIFEAHCARILLCSGPGACVWLIVQPIFPSF